MKTFALTIHTNRLVVLGLGGIALFSAIFYMYGISKTVHTVALRQELETELSARTASVSELEFEYLALKNTVDLDMAESLGFKTTETAHYVSRRTPVAYSGTTLARDTR